MDASPSLVVFDVVGTLFSLDRVEEVLSEHGCPDGSLELWFARLLHAAFASTLAGRYAPYREVGASTLRQVADLWGFDASVVPGALAAMSEMEARPEAEACLEELAASGRRLVAITNGGPGTLAELMERSGLGRFFEALRSADSIGRCKPHPAPYRAILEQAALEPAEACMVAAHGWDILGADAVGMDTVYVCSLEGRWPLLGEPPGQAVPSLAEVPQAVEAPASASGPAASSSRSSQNG